MEMVSNCFILFLFMPLLSIASNDAPSSQMCASHIDAGKQDAPTNTRMVYLHSDTGRFMEIKEDGTIKGALDTSSRGTLLELQVYGVGVLRIKRPNTDMFLAINEYGKPYIKKERKVSVDTLLLQVIVDEKVAYKNCDGWFLAIKRNGKLKKGIRHSPSGTLPRSAQFVTDFVSKSKMCCQ